MRGMRGTRCRALRERGCLCGPGHPNRSRRSKRPPMPNWPGQAGRRSFAELGSADRSKLREPSARADGRHKRERGRPPAARRAGTTVDAAATAMPPGRALERDGDRRTPESWSRPRTRRRSGRSPPSRCPRVRARRVSAAAATLPPQGVRARAGPRPLTGRRYGCARRAPASGGHRGPARARASGRRPAAETAPAFATVTASSTVAPLAIAAVAARDSRRYCWRRGKLNPPVRLIGAAGDQPCGDGPTAPGRTDDPARDV